MVRLTVGAAAAIITLCAMTAHAQQGPTRTLAGRYFAKVGFGAESYEKPPVYKGEYAKLYEERLESRRVGKVIGDPTAGCSGGGFPRVMAVPYATEILDTPEMIVWLWEGGDRVRRIYKADRNTLKPMPPLYSGLPVGHWEGDTFVIQSEGFVAATLMHPSGAPHSPALKVTERLRFIDGNDLIEDVATFEDPEALVEPFVQRWTLKRDDSIRMMEYSCEENNRNPINSDGHVSTTLGEGK
jgi:hypothetical protein